MSSGAPARVRFTYPAGDGGVVIDLEGTAPEEHILNLIRAHRRFYGRDLLDHLAVHGPRGGVYVDVGANIGNHSVFFGRFLADQVVAVEPDPHLLRLLARNLHANGVVEWTTVAVALGAEPGVGTLSPREGYEGNAGAQRVVSAAPDAGTATVPVDTLDRVLAGLGPETAAGVSLVKLDIEGMELEALHGARQLLENHGPDVVVEAAGEAEHAAVASLLESYGYRQVARFCITPTYHFTNRGRPWARGPAPRKDSKERP